MVKPFKGVINVDVTESVPDWGPYTQPIAPEGTPSVLYIVLDEAASGFPSSNGHVPFECGTVVDLAHEARMAFARD